MLPRRPPAPEYAFFQAGRDPWRIRFNQELQPGQISPANFDVTHALDDKVVTGAIVVGKEVRLGGNASAVFTPPDGIAYHAAPNEIFNLEGTPAAAFPKIPFLF